jgi:Flp pilus assembly protein TadB
MSHDAWTDRVDRDAQDTDERRARLRHRLLMFACCVPMLVVVGLLVATGTLGVWTAVAALLCVLLMPLLHGGGSHGHGGGRHRH